MTPTFAFVWLFTRGGTRFSRGGEIDTDLLKNSLQLHLSSMLLGTIMLLWAFDVHMSTSSYVYLIAGAARHRHSEHRRHIRAIGAGRSARGSVARGGRHREETQR
eukprot:CAMPEP_0180194776 /NCGR_PEP_ID=MMETSP0987-20121128/3219_1 /TAXON_ID=697907 /ORGANISM="non described non described, Strain CCMP2293" /LENGTH=104 /DNA_ID=CAMNT_0022149543 /DNA_START=109 /DNA_END=420 /DNA_ORIENTATION=+